MNKISWALAVLFGFTTALMTYLFVFSGNAEKSTDGRLAISLTVDERDLVLGEMNAFLAHTQQIIKGIAEDDLAMSARAANQVGRAAQQGMPGTLVGKLPMEFKKLGFDTHARFSQLALDAEQLGDKAHTLEQLSVLMENCVACHQTYKFTLAPSTPQ